MKNKTLYLILLVLIFMPLAINAYDISFANPTGTTGTITLFFESVITGILNIIAFLGVLFIVIAGVVYLIGASSGNDSMLGTAKKIWTGSIIGLALALAGPTFLKEIKDIVLGVGGTVPTDLTAAPTLTDIVANTLNFLLSIIGIIAIISLVISGLLYLFSGGDSSRADLAKKNITFSIVGLLIAGSALILVKLIVWFIENP